MTESVGLHCRAHIGFGIAALVCIAEAPAQMAVTRVLDQPMPFSEYRVAPRPSDWTVPHVSVGGQVLRGFAWPAYAAVPASSRNTKLDRAESLVLSAERLGFLADAVTTERALSGKYHEMDPLNTCFGNRNRSGVLVSMTAWELGFSSASIVAPRWFEHTRFRRASRVAAFIGGGVFAALRARTSLHNAQLLDRPYADSDNTTIPAP